MKRMVTAETVAAAFADGQKRVEAPRAAAIVTPSAWSKARELNVLIDQSDAPSAGMADPGSSERSTDPSGVTVVRGKSVRLGKFSGAGLGREVGLTDLITSRDGAPMTAGIMSWGREDSFPWSLDYDEIDLVLEGTLHIRIGGRVVEGHVGDVIYIPKGSRIEFATPSRVKVFYVTYPADWSSAASVRPQK